MREYLTIGEFSKLSGMSIKSLRYYDRIGILKPVYVSEDTSYRYYSRKQLSLTSLILISLMLDIPLNFVQKEFISDNEMNYELFLSYAKNLLQKRIKNLEDNLSFIQDMSLNFKREKQINYDEYKEFVFEKKKLLLIPFDGEIGTLEYDKLVSTVFDIYIEEEKNFKFLYGVMKKDEKKYFFVEMSNNKLTKKRKDHMIFSFEEGLYECKLTDDFTKEVLDFNYLIFESLLPGQKPIYEIIRKKN